MQTLSNVHHFSFFSYSINCCLSKTLTIFEMVRFIFCLAPLIFEIKKYDKILFLNVICRGKHAFRLSLIISDHLGLFSWQWKHFRTLLRSQSCGTSLSSPYRPDIWQNIPQLPPVLFQKHPSTHNIHIVRLPRTKLKPFGGICNSSITSVALS